MNLHGVCRLLVLLVAVSGVGCASLDGPGTLERPLMPLTKVVPTERSLQKLTISWRDQQHDLLGVVERGDHRVSMAVLTPEGLVLFSVVHDSDGVHVERNPVIPAALSPRHVLADVQLLNWPAEEQTYPPPWRLVEDLDRRTLMHGERQVAQAQFFPSLTQWSVAQMTDEATGYQLRIEAVEQHGG